jgi:chemotaxis protein CheZ
MNPAQDGLDEARALVAALEAGEHERARTLLDELARLRDGDLFQKIGQLTRTLHEALNDMPLDGRLTDLAEHEMPDARERLDYVIKLTDQAANRTLDLAEQSLPICARIAAQSDAVRADAGALHDNLNEIVMAQSYQDLSGQIIRRVTRMVHEVEGSLVELVRLTGARGTQTAPDDSGAQGPAVPGVDKNRVNGQDDVDSLLSSLGF